MLLSDTPLHKNREVKYTQKHHDAIKTLGIELAKACDSAFCWPKPSAQYKIMSDASFYATGFVLMIEHYIRDQTSKPMETYVPVLFGHKLLGPIQLKYSSYATDFLAVHFAFDSLAQFLWKNTKPTIVSTDNRPLTRFFEAKPSSLTSWLCVDHVPHIHFILGHVPVKANLAGEYLSRIRINADTKLDLKKISKPPTCEVDFNSAL